MAGSIDARLRKLEAVQMRNTKPYKVAQIIAWSEDDERGQIAALPPMEDRDWIIVHRIVSPAPRKEEEALLRPPQAFQPLAAPDPYREAENPPRAFQVLTEA